MHSYNTQTLSAPCLNHVIFLLAQNLCIDGSGLIQNFKTRCMPFNRADPHTDLFNQPQAEYEMMKPPPGAVQTQNGCIDPFHPYHLLIDYSCQTQVIYRSVSEIVVVMPFCWSFLCLLGGVGEHNIEQLATIYYGICIHITPDLIKQRHHDPRKCLGYIPLVVLCIVSLYVWFVVFVCTSYRTIHISHTQ